MVYIYVQREKGEEWEGECVCVCVCACMHQLEDSMKALEIMKSIHVCESKVCSESCSLLLGFIFTPMAIQSPIETCKNLDKII
mgnify:CR=1 FL=1